MRIVFMGTPDFAVPSLQALLRSDDHVVGVVTQPDRPKGRGQMLVPPPVKVIAEQAGIPVVQPLKMRTPDFLEILAGWKPDLIAVAAFGRILHAPILNLPPLGCVNVHGSLLPKYRGAAPIQWALINGETETGITTMQMDEGMDTGPILLQAKIPILPDDTTSTLAPRLAKLGGELLMQTIAGLKAGTIRPIPQDHSQATLAPILKKEDGEIQWTMSATALVNRIRGLSPWPGAYTFHGADRWMIWKAVAVQEPTTGQPGTVLAVTKQSIKVATGDGVLELHELQIANSKRMTVGQYLAGHRLSVGERLGAGA
ncbi:MAG: methionyl-tRNA formyltransferase [Nitrospira sp.]|nr:methionyl-tRNA formyltransferase [Nitrospira sp.]MCP9464083.1 methionyl-tRNA formyltransferase [Nitrospira sp.]